MGTNVMTNDNLEDALKYYLLYAIDGQKSWISDGMNNLIPQSMGDAINLARNNLKQNDSFLSDNDKEIKSVLGKIFKRTNKKYKILTPKAKKHLEMFLYDDNSLVVEVSHQPKFLGGERFLFNKVACGSAFSELNESAFPIFYVADYDKVHTELIKTKFSQSDSPNGFSVSIDHEIENKFTGMRIKNLPLPTYDYIEEIFQDIRSKYKNSFNMCVDDNWQKSLLEERLEEAIRLIKISYHSSVDYTDWFINIVGIISNIIFDQGYLFLSASDLDYKKILTPFYENLLKNQQKYVDSYVDIQNQFMERGIKSPLRDIGREFVPFFYECTDETCHCKRNELSCEDYGSMIHVKCKCDHCGKLIDFSIDKAHPDLSEHSIFFTPRVESRQYLVSKTINPAIHVAGTGETRYYTMAIPLLKKFDEKLTLPVIYFYNKTTMNTFMTRKLEQDIINLNLPGFLDNIKGLMKNTGKFNKLTKKSAIPEREKLIEILRNMDSFKLKIEKLCMNYESKNSEEKNLILSYLSNMFGRISKEKHGQEVVFHWLDLCLKNGFSKLFEDYSRIYRSWLPPGMEIFV